MEKIKKIDKFIEDTQNIIRKYLGGIAYNKLAYVLQEIENLGDELKDGKDDNISK